MTWGSNMFFVLSEVVKWFISRFLSIFLDRVLIRPEKLDDGVRRSCQLQLKKLRAELNQWLNKPILPLTESLRYPRFEAVQAFLQKRASSKCE